jgi:predicted kinase
MAFLVMDLLFRGWRGLASAFADGYFGSGADPRGRELLSFYVAYRAAVRGKVEGMAAFEAEVPESQRKRALQTSRAHWLLALSELEDPDRRPCLVLVAGLPGSGKSTLAGLLESEAGFRAVSSDRVRKELAGLEPTDSAAAAFGEGIYSSQWNDRTYAACLERAGELLFQGERVVVDASFRESARRRAFLEGGVAWGVRTLMLCCHARPEVALRRIGARAGNASDATSAVYERAAALWEPVESDMDPRWRICDVPTDGARAETLHSALSHLRESGLAGP